MSKPNIITRLCAAGVLPQVLADLLGLDSPPKPGSAIRCVYPDRHANRDAHPSLVISKNGAGAKCLACGFGGRLLDIAKDRLGLKTNAAAAAELEKRYLPAPATIPLGPPEAIYDYTNADGKLMYQSLRYRIEKSDGTAGKTFKLRRPHDSRPGNWISNLAGTKPLLFRLPRVLVAVQRGEPIFVAEGEKDVLALESAGATATTNHGGAEQWLNAHTDALEGADEVVVVADKDEPGRKHARKVAEALTPLVEKIRVVEAASGHDAFDHLDAGHGLNDFVPVDLDLGDGDDAYDGHDDDPHCGSSSSSRPSAATRLVDLALDAVVELFHDPHDRAFAVIEFDGHKETRPLRTKPFKSWLAREFYESEGKAAANQALQDALMTLEGIAVHEGPRQQVFVRWARHADGIYLDLGRPEWDAVRITQDSWSVIAESPVRFWRPTGFGEMPLPVAGGSWDRLWSLLNVHPEERVLLQACVSAAARPEGPYIVLVVQGPQGAAKTTLARVFGKLIDPNEVPVRAFPRDERDLLIAAQNRSLLVYDNLSRLSDDMADALCRLATGGGLSKRQLYTDDDEMVFGAMRPVVLTSIADLATRADVLDRAVLLNLLAIPDDARRPEDGYWREFEAGWPQHLGLVLDAVSAGLRNVDAVQLSQYPRMADFARWVSAAECTFGVESGTFLKAYNQNRAFGHELGLEASILAPVVRDFVRDRQAWAGTATELLGELEKGVEAAVAERKAWPKTASKLASELRRLASSLGAVGIHIEFDRLGKRRQIRLEAKNAVIGVTGVRPPTDSGPSSDGEGDSSDAHPESPSSQQAAPAAKDDVDDGDSPSQSRPTVVREHIA